MSFFQHVRTAHLQAQAADRPYHALGSDTEPHLEPVRFTVQNTLAFPATAVSRIWQYQAMRVSLQARGAVAGIKGQYTDTDKNQAYYGINPKTDAGKKFQDFNMEQQGTLLEYYYDAKYRNYSRG
jgi:hypothetical protein